jgi:hypothetical protein
LTVAIGALATCLGLGAAGAPAAGANIIYNPNFAYGLQGWHTMVQAKGSEPGYPHFLALPTPSEPIRKCDRAQRGHHFLQLNVPAGAAGYVEQSLIMPVRPGRLTFRTWGGAEAVRVTVSIVSGPFVRRLLAYTPPDLVAARSGCSGKRPRIVSLNVAQFAGQAVGLRIRATSHALGGALADFDSFALQGR